MSPVRMPDMRRVRRLAIVKLGAIGDVVHALPVSASLGEAFPHIEISWVVEERAAPLVSGNPYLCDVIALPTGWWGRTLADVPARQRALRERLRPYRFEVALDLQGLTKSALVAWASGARYRYGYDWLRELAPLFVTRVPRRPESIHIVDQLLDVARFLGAPGDDVRFPLDIPSDDEATAHALLADAGIPAGRPFIAINPTAGGGGNKGWDAGRYVQLLDALYEDPGLPVVLVGGPGDRDVAARICGAALPPPADLVGQTSLKELAAVLRAASLHICGDTGSAHIAAALGTRTMTLFGRSNPARLAPYGQADWVIHHRECCHQACKRLHQTSPVNSKQKCVAPPPACMAAIAVDEVVATARRALAERRVGVGRLSR